MIRKLYNKKAQEEMVGFGIIIVIVAIILLVFLSISLKNPSKSSVESYEVEGYIQSFLQYTTTCEKDYAGNYIDVTNLIFKCEDNLNCYEGSNSCNVLYSTLEGISDENWKYGEEYPVKGYLLNIYSGNNSIIHIEKGNLTSNYKGSSQSFAKNGKIINIEFSAYY